MGGFFSLDSPFMRLMNNIANLIILNLLTMLCCIPIVTAGAAFSALHYVLMQMFDETDGKIAATYFREFKGNLKRAVPVWLVFLAAAFIIFIDYRVYALSEGTWKWVLIPVIVGAILFGSLFVWIFPLMARFDNTLRANFRNAALLALGYAPRTLAMIAITAVVPVTFLQVMSLLPLFFFAGLSLPAYLSMLLYYPVLGKMVKAAQKEAGLLDEDEEPSYGEADRTVYTAENITPLPAGRNSVPADSLTADDVPADGLLTDSLTEADGEA